MPLPKDIKPTLNKHVNIAIGTAQAFVITKANQKVDEILEQLLNSCPPPRELERLSKVIATLKLTTLIADRKVSKASKAADTVAPIIAGLTLLVELLLKDPRGNTSYNGNNLPLLILPGGFPSVVRQNSRGKIKRGQERLRWLQSAIFAFSDDVLAIRDAVSSAKGVLDPVKAKLNQIDALIQACFSNQDLSDEERKLILDDIQLSYTDPVTTSLSYRSRSGKDYTIKIIKDPNSPEIAPKRQAIVQDFRGITVLTGPSSFASRPSILVEEIKFRIENQLP